MPNHTKKDEKLKLTVTYSNGQQIELTPENVHTIEWQGVSVIDEVALISNKQYKKLYGKAYQAGRNSLEEKGE